MEKCDQLVVAVEKGDLKTIVDYVETHCVSVNCRNNNGVTALMEACANGNIEIVRYLISKGANLETFSDNPNHNQEPALMWAVWKNQKKIICLLIEYGANINVSNNLGLTPLMLAIRLENCELVKLLIDQGSDVNAVDKYKKTALMWACYETKNLEIIKVLINSGADLQKKDINGWSAMHHAKAMSRKSVVNLLKTFGVND